MVEVVHDLDPILDRVHDRDLSHQHLRKTFSLFIFLFIDISCFSSVVVQLMHAIGIENQVIVYMFHHSIHEHLDVISKKSLLNLAPSMK